MPNKEDEIISRDRAGAATGSLSCALKELFMVVSLVNWAKSDILLGRRTISMTWPRTISSIIPVVSALGSPVSPETNIIYHIVSK